MKTIYPQKHKNISRRGITPFLHFSVIFANGSGVMFFRVFCREVSLNKKEDRKRKNQRERQK
jgi:hypothetical protein